MRETPQANGAGAVIDTRLPWLLLLSLSASAVMLDQWIKHLVVTSLRLGEQVVVTGWFNLVHVLNPGAAFSFLAGAGGWQRWFFIALGIAVSVVLAALLRRGAQPPLETAAYVGLIGGAMGNVVDRLRLGAVVDYLDFHWQGMHWPAFNIADIFVVGSVGLLLLASFGMRTKALRDPQERALWHSQSSGVVAHCCCWRVW